MLQQAIDLLALIGVLALFALKRAELQHFKSRNSDRWLFNWEWRFGRDAKNKPGDGPQQKGQFRLMYIVKADNPDVGFAIVPGAAQDSEGHPAELALSELDITVESTNGNSVSVIRDAPTNLEGRIHFGDPGDAQVVVTIAKKDGTILEKLDAGFHVTAGDPSRIAGGEIKFTGLVEAPAPPAPPPVIEAPKSLSYASPMTCEVGTEITPNVPLVGGGTPDSYSVSPTLPRGLSIDSTTGVISGTPEAKVSAADYTVVATNGGGSASAVVNITVSAVASPQTGTATE